MRRYLILRHFPLLVLGCGGGESIALRHHRRGRRAHSRLGDGRRGALRDPRRLLLSRRGSATTSWSFASPGATARPGGWRSGSSPGARRCSSAASPWSDGVAFPLSLEDESDTGGGGQRSAARHPRRRYPSEWTSRAALLSRSRSGDALLVRPKVRGLPDLRVVVTPGTEVRTQDGDPRLAREHRFRRHPPDRRERRGRVRDRHARGGSARASPAARPTTMGGLRVATPRERPTSTPPAQPAPVAASRSSERRHAREEPRSGRRHGTGAAARERGSGSGPRTAGGAGKGARELRVELARL
jgi:hypothetical protein